MGVLCLCYLILSVRTNLVFFLIFLFLIPAFGCLTAAFWHLAEDHVANAAVAQKEILVAGALTFVVDMLGWYIFMAIMLASLDFPFQLPVVDLSRFVKGGSEIAKAKEQSLSA